MSEDKNTSILREKYEKTFKEFSKEKKIKKIYKLSLLSLLLVYLILVLVYFSLPSFKLSGMNFQGLVNLSKEDVISLLGERNSKSLLFFNSKGKDKLLEENSGGLILNDSVSISTDSFSGNVKIEEDYPVCYIDNNLYCLSSSTFDEFKSKIDNSKLSEYSKVKLKEHFSIYEDNSKKFLPTVHIPSSFNDRYQDINSRNKDALKYLKGVDFKTLSTKVSAINYLAYTSDNSSHFNSVSEIYVDDTKNDYSFVITNIRSNYLSYLLEYTTFSSIISAINFEISQKKDTNPIKNAMYVTSDNTTYSSSYFFRFRMDETIKNKSFMIESVSA